MAKRNFAGPRFCWECGSALRWPRGRLEPYYANKFCVDGFWHRIHKECMDEQRATDKREERYGDEA